MIRVQTCPRCGTAQYPPRDFCGECLHEGMDWLTADALPARVLSATLLHHSNEPRFRADLPLRIGLIRFDLGPVALCFLPRATNAGDVVSVRFDDDNRLVAE